LLRRFIEFCEGLKNFVSRWNRGTSIDVEMSVANLLNHGRRFVRCESAKKEEFNMKRLSAITAMVLGGSIMASQAMYAAPLAVHSPMHAMFGRDKLVKFALHNATDTPIKVKTGDTEVLLPPGQDVPFKLPVGSKVVVEEGTGHYTPGVVIAVAESQLSDTTVRLN